MYKVKLTEGYLSQEYEFETFLTAGTFVQIALDTHKGDTNLEAVITRVPESLGEKLAKAKEEKENEDEAV